MKYREFPVQTNRPAAFTMVEMLAVLAIVAILFVLTTLAIGSLGQGRKLTVAGNLTTDLINHARQVAKARNTLTTFAVLNSGPDAGRVLANFVYSPGTGTAGSWSQLDRWTILPEGIQIDLDASDEFLRTSQSGTIPQMTNFPRGGQAAAGVSAIFLPDGRAYNPSSELQVVLLRNAAAGSNQPNYYKIIVNDATGIPIIRRP